MELRGVGLYTMPEAARILSCALKQPISRDRLARWIRGYKYKDARATSRTVKPVIGSALARYGANLLTFAELMDLSVIAALRREGLSFPKVRAAYELGQLPFDEVLHALLRNVTYKDGRAVRFSPLGKDRSVVIDPERSFGKPVNRATGIPTASLYHMHLGHESNASIAQWYGVTLDAVSEAIEYESALAKIKV
jgi:uncharacterized protein (DUF433 family)